MSDASLRHAEREFASRPSVESAACALSAARRAGSSASASVLGWVLDLRRWNELPGQVQDDVAASVLARGPIGLAFEGVETSSLGSVAHRVAFFRLGDGTRWALAPGGEVTLGFDRSVFVPSAAQSAEFVASTTTQFGCTLEEYLAGLQGSLENSNALTPVRSVRVQPLLVEVDARALTAGSVARTRRALAEGGFELPSSDEWEHLCGAGARTLFRWGDDCPVDCAPPEAGLGWDLHRKPNAFGLRFSPNPCDQELVRETNLLRGGDGGGMICGGAGSFAAWICLATSFESSVELDGYPTERLAARRVWRLMDR